VHHPGAAGVNWCTSRARRTRPPSPRSTPVGQVNAKRRKRLG